jgi:hypothetical protein
MKKLLALSVLSVSMLSSVVAHAATAELKLVGTITPSACVPNFTGGSTINYGNIPAGSLNANAQTSLPLAATKLSVVCDAPVKFAIKPFDERNATVATGVVPSAGVGVANNFGLGSAPDGANIGAYTLQLTGETSDVGTTRRLSSGNAGATWALFGGYLSGSGNTLVAFSNGSNNSVPAAHTTVTADISISAAIDKSVNLPMADEIPIDGLATFEIVYL